MGESNNTNIVREIIISQCCISVEEDWGAQVPFPFLSVFNCQMHRLFPQKRSVEYDRVKNQISDPGRWPWTGVKYRSAQMSLIFSVRPIVSVFLMETLINLIWVCSIENYQNNCMIRASVLLQSEAEKSVSGSWRKKNTEFLCPISSVKISHLPFWFVIQITNIGWALLWDLRLWLVIDLSW